MTVELQSIEVRGPRRVRLRYTNTLGAGAFVTSWFSIVSVDEVTADPLVVAVMLVPGFPEQIELQLSLDLAPGGSYELTSAAGIPAGDASTTALDVSNFRPATPRQAPSISVSSADVRTLLYGEDLVHDGQDMVETHDGDLATISGEANALNAVVRRALADGLPYNPGYGPKLRRFVDAPSPSIRAGRGDLERNARLDDRVKRITAELAPDDNTGDVTINVNVELIGGSKHSLSRSL